MISDAATISDVVQTLRHPEEYVRSVLGNMAALRRAYGDNVWVRIGRTGDGKALHYRIDQRWEREPFFEGCPPHVSLLPIGAFRGTGHKPLVPSGEEPDILHDSNWTTGTMSFEEVRALLGKLRTMRSPTSSR